MENINVTASCDQHFSRRSLPSKPTMLYDEVDNNSPHHTYDSLPSPSQLSNNNNAEPGQCPSPTHAAYSKPQVIGTAGAHSQLHSNVHRTTLDVKGQVITRTNNKSSSQLADQGSPSKRRSTHHEVYTHLQELEQKRSTILQEINTEENQKRCFFEKLEVLEKRLKSLPMDEQSDATSVAHRKQLESDTNELRQLIQSNLGSTALIVQRHEQRMKRVRDIETQMLQIQQNHTQQLDLEKRDSGTCDHLETDRDGIVVVDAATNTLVSGDVFSGNDDDRALVMPNNEASVVVGGYSNNGVTVTMATQTAAERALVEAEKIARRVSYQPDKDTNGYVGESGTNREQHNMSTLYHGSWTVPTQLDVGHNTGASVMYGSHPDTASVMSFHSSATNQHGTEDRKPVTNQQLSTKVEMVYSLLSMLGTHDKDDMSRTLLAMSSSQDSCVSMRRSGCLPLLIQLLHGSDHDSGLMGNTRGGSAARARAAAALHNIVHSHPDDKRGRREARVLRLLEQIRAHCDQVMAKQTGHDGNNDEAAGDIDHHPGPAIAALMKLSFDEEHRHAICTLGGLQAIAELLQIDHESNAQTNLQYNVTMRRYACMALTNLTFGDGTNKALLCSMLACMRALVAQLNSNNEDLRQVAASVLRNLSWRADLASKKTLRGVGAVAALTLAAMDVRKESTLKSVLSALWNLSAHCSENKADICAVDGALSFLVATLTYRSPSKTLAVIENGGGILRNISSHVAVREDYRRILREHCCLNVLLKHLRSPSLTIVSNACGTLWNLSARCLQDQHALWEMGAVPMLRNLVHSKHKMISMGSAAALKNLINAGPPPNTSGRLDAGGPLRTNMPGLHVRRQRALEAEIDQSLSETCDNVESPQDSPNEVRKNYQKTSHHDVQQIHLQGHNNDRFIYDPNLASSNINNEGNCGTYQLADTEQHRRSLLKTQPFGRSYTSAEGANMLDGHVRSPIAPVSRSGSQDSIRSVHSDISHDRNHTKYGIGNPQGHDSRPPNIKNNFTRDESKHSNYDAEDSNAFTGRVADGKRFLKARTDKNAMPYHEQSGNVPANDLSSIQPVHNERNNHHDRKIDDIENEPSQDEPIDYGSKYSEMDNYDKPVPKINNYMEVGTTQSSSPYKILHPADRVNDVVDQRVNYSQYQPQSTHVTYGSNVLPMDHDTVKLFCTEDTPLTHMSTATSMNDVRDVNKCHVNVEEKTNSLKNDSVVNSYHTLSQQGTLPQAQEQNTGSDEPKTFCEEGTPVCFSRVSSLSSLHSSDLSENCSLSGHSSTATHSHKHGAQSAKATDTTALQSIDENSSLVLSDTTELNKNMCNKTVACDRSERLGDAPAQHAVQAKSVTFDESSNQQTPMMFSRCSSLGSLSSFDAQSVHSSVISEYSRRTSEVVSPSDLPDSPGDTMPSSPKFKINKSILEDASDNGEFDITQIENPLHKASDPMLGGNESDECTKDYSKLDVDAKHQFSCDTSLSALTMDDDQIRNNDNSTSAASKPQYEVQKKYPNDSWSDDSDNDSTGEEILAECIQQGLPSNSHGKTSQHHCARSMGGYSTNYSVQTHHVSTKCHAATYSSLPNTVQNTTYGEVPRVYCTEGTPIKHGVPIEECSEQVSDSMKTYAVEGTPLISHAPSYSDISTSSNVKQATNGTGSDSVRVYGVEGTPATFSRNDSLSSIDCNNSSSENNSKSSHLQTGTKQETEEYLSMAEDKYDKLSSQVLFKKGLHMSPNCSLSSLSVDSLNLDNSATDAALLDECIHLGMPKSKGTPGGVLATDSNINVMHSKHAATEDMLDKSTTLITSNDFSSDIKNIVSAIEESEKLATDTDDDSTSARDSKGRLVDKPSKWNNSDSMNSCNSEPIVSKEDIESTKENTMSVSSAGVSDIMLESFPDMGGSIVSNITTPDTDNPSVQHDGNQASPTFCFETSELPAPYLSNRNSIDNEFIKHEAALEEQAQIVLSEISRKKGMVDSSVSDDMFIEDERLSLVSVEDDNGTIDACLNMQPDDCPSEAVSLARQKDANSDEVKDEQKYERPTIEEDFEVKQIRSGPRIVKSPEDTSKIEHPPNESKGIRGRRKLLYPGKKTNTVASPPPPVIKPKKFTPESKKQAASVHSTGVDRLTKSNTASKKNEATAFKKPSAQNTTPPKQPSSTVSTPRTKLDANRQISQRSPSVESTSRFRSNSPKYSGNRSTTTSNARSAISKDQINERQPAKLVKQNTFTKEVSMQQNAKSSVPESKAKSQNKPLKSSPVTHSQDKITKKSSPGTLGKPPKTRDISVTRRNSNSPGRLNTSNSNSNQSLSKNSSRSSLNSLNSSPSSKLTKKNVASIKPLPHVRGKKKEPEIPTKKTETTSKAKDRESAIKPTIRAPGKKPAVSKIASLWRKDDSNQPKRKETEAERALKKQSIQVIVNTEPDKPCSDENEKQVKPKLIRSSTYDKIPVDKEDVEIPTVEPPVITTGEEKELSGKKMWRRTYTIEDDGLMIQTCGAWQNSDGQKPNGTNVQKSEKKKSGIALFKRNSKSKTESNKPQLSKPKLGLWKRHKNDKLKSPGDVGEVVSTEGTGIWIKQAVEAKDDQPQHNKRPPLSPTQLPSASNAAIVAPFNYIPHQEDSDETTHVSAKQKACTLPCNVSPPTEGTADVKSSTSVQSLDSIPKTKTEMLLERRRRSYMAHLSAKSEELTYAPVSDVDDMKDNKSPSLSSKAEKESCLFTAV